MPSEDELIIGGDGKSAETPIQFRPCHIMVRVARERLFVSEQFGAEGIDWSELMHYTSFDNQSVWVLELRDGNQKEVYFDTSQTIYDEA